MLSCKEATRLMLKKEEQKIGLLTHFNLWLHIIMCPLCKLFSKQSKQISTLSSKLQQSNQSLSVDEKQEIIQAIEATTQ